MMLSGACHRGRVTIALDRAPDEVNECNRSSCTTHWGATEAYVRHAGKDDRMGVKVRLFDQALLAGVPTRAIDGRSWNVDKEWA